MFVVDKLEVDGLCKYVGGVCGGFYYVWLVGDVVVVGVGDVDGYFEFGV